MALIVFQSTHPARGATWRSLDAMEPIVISIHAPREGCDWWWKMVCSYRCHFNPRTPRGVRPTQYGGMTGEKHFQSTHPARGATARERKRIKADNQFQSTHPARGATPHNLSDLKVARNFNPRTPRGVRLQNQEIQYHQQEFQSTHPARGATLTLGQPAYTSGISIHAPREGCDR